MNEDELDKKFDEFAARIEQRFDELSKSSKEHPINEQPAAYRMLRENRDKPFWGTALIVFGLILLSNHFDWFNFDIPILPAALVIIGCYLIITNR